jgi:hypothetical protein
MCMTKAVRSAHAVHILFEVEIKKFEIVIGFLSLIEYTTSPPPRINHSPYTTLPLQL